MSSKFNPKNTFDYRVFNSSDFNNLDFLTYQEAKKLDYIDIRNMPLFNKNVMLLKYDQEYFDDYNNKNQYTDYYFFKEFCLREIPIMYNSSYFDITDKEERLKALGDNILNNNCDNQIRYWRYYISDWDKADKEKGIDSRNLLMQSYTFFLDGDERDIEWIVGSKGKYKEVRPLWRMDGSYLMKLAHIPYLIMKTSDLTDLYDKDKVAFNQDKLLDFPVYISYGSFRFLNEKTGQIITDIKDNRYRRFGDIIKGIYEEDINFYNNSAEFCIKNLGSPKYSEVSMIMCGLRRFTAMNRFMIDTLMSKEPADISILDEEGDVVLSKKVKNITSYISKATEDKQIKIDINDVEIKTNLDKANVISDGAVRKICDYKFQVRSHYQRYWVGKGDNKHVELRKKESYYKNNDKQFKVIKEITDKESSI